MFQQLRPNSQIYILHRGDPLQLETGFVTNVSIPRLKSNGIALNNQNMIVDIAVNVGGQTMTYAQLDANADVAESLSNGENIIIATNKDVLNAKIASLKQISQDIVNSVDFHLKLVTEYDKVLQLLNPEVAEKELQKNEIKMMKEQMDLMSKNMADLMAANKALIEKLNKKNE